MPQLDELKEKIRDALRGLDRVIGWEIGFDALHATPFFFKTEERYPSPKGNAYS